MFTLGYFDSGAWGRLEFRPFCRFHIEEMSGAVTRVAKPRGRNSNGAYGLIEYHPVAQRAKKRCFIGDLVAAGPTSASFAIIDDRGNVVGHYCSGLLMVFSQPLTRALRNSRPVRYTASACFDQLLALVGLTPMRGPATTALAWMLAQLAAQNVKIEAVRLMAMSADLADYDIHEWR